MELSARPRRTPTPSEGVAVAGGLCGGEKAPPGPIEKAPPGPIDIVDDAPWPSSGGGACGAKRGETGAFGAMRGETGAFGAVRGETGALGAMRGETGACDWLCGDGNVGEEVEGVKGDCCCEWPGGDGIVGGKLEGVKGAFCTHASEQNNWRPSPRR
mmetsp:Transcript_17705/g.34511  ORF Transcript_17705/g.34511 Transcript_17705/m.34511 type:complete len:157 (-) Transcript_17705:505-975(-)